jgi:two-component system OmpR family response regulator
MAQVLVVDDDSHIRQVVRYALERAGHTVEEAQDGAAALACVARSEPDLLVLDIVMPEDDGLSVCRRIRQTSRLPIIFLSSRDEELDRVLGLELGADDYLTKPFSPRELVARVSAVLRRAMPQQEEGRQPRQFRHGRLTLDEGRHHCAVDGQEVTLTVMEFSLLAALLAEKGRVFERGQLVERAYGKDHYLSERTVDSHIRRVRKKLLDVGLDPIETVYGVGYRLKDEPA